MYAEKINGLRIRGKIDWYEHAEKSSKFFLNLRLHKNLGLHKIKLKTISKMGKVY